MLTIFDLFGDDVINNKDNSCFKNLIDISNDKYNEDDNEIKDLEEVCILNKSGNCVYYYDTQKNKMYELDPVFLTLIAESATYRFSVKRNIDAGLLRFFRRIPKQL